MGAERKSAVINDKVKKRTAYHEVGTACLEGICQVAHILLQSGWSCAGGTVHRRRYASTQSDLYATRSCARHCKLRSGPVLTVWGQFDILPHQLPQRVKTRLTSSQL